MIEKNGRVWVDAESFNFDEKLDLNKKIEFNVKINGHISEEKLEALINNIRSRKCGFLREFPSIVFHVSLNIVKEIIAVVSKLDDTIPPIKVNVIINEENLKKENIISCLHVCYDLIKKHNIFQQYTFLIEKELVNINLMLFIAKEFNMLVASHNNKIPVSIYCDVIPNLVLKEGVSYASSQTSLEYLINTITRKTEEGLFDFSGISPICGAISLLYYTSLIKEMQEKYDSIDALQWVLKGAQEQQGCYYNCDHNCEQCIQSLLSKVPKDLGCMSKIAHNTIYEKADTEELKILEADWDYIV